MILVPVVVEKNIKSVMEDNSVYKDIYYVAVKLFIEDSEGNLLILKDVFGDWDLPGGRLRNNDFKVGLRDIVKRKVKEELGNSFSYILMSPVVYFRHERDEVINPNKKEKKRIFAIGYRAKFTGGEIHLGKNHCEYKWVPKFNFEPDKYFTGGWLKGLEEYLKKFGEKTVSLKLGIYQHFKGGKYEVLGVVKHSETSEEMVLYKHLDDGTLWVRPKSMFLETVQKQGKKIPRFKFISQLKDDKESKF